MHCIKSSYREKFPFLDWTNNRKNRQQRVKKGQIVTTNAMLEKEKMTVSELRRESIGEEKEALKVIFFFEKLAILQFLDNCYLFCNGDGLLTEQREHILS